MGRNSLTLYVVAFLLSNPVSAVELQDIQAKLYAPSSIPLRGLDASRIDANTLLSAVLARAQSKKPATPVSLSDCAVLNVENTATACKLILLGNHLNDGHFAAYAQVLASMTAEQLRRAEQFIAQLDVDTLKRVGDRQIGLLKRTQIVLSSEENDYLKSATDPLLEVEINGHAAKVLFDTGASVTVIGESDALRYGVELIKLPVEINSYYSRQSVNAQYGLIREMTLSGIELRNVLVIVGGSLSLFGLDLMSSFDNVIVGSEHIALNVTPAEIEALEQQCVGSVFLGSSYSRQTQFLYVLANVDGQQTAASLDTGNLYYLSGGETRVGSARSDQRSKIMTDANGTFPRAITHTTTNLNIGGRAKDVSYTTLAEQKYLTPYVLGWPAFQDYELIWNTHESRACYKQKIPVQ